MNIKNLILVSVIGAAISVVFSNVSFLNFTVCFCCAPYWASAIFAVWLYRRMTFPGSLTLGQGVIIGLLIGLLATAASLALSMLGLFNTAELMNRVQSFVPPDSNISIPMEINTEYRFGCSCGVEVIFCLIGGLIGGALFRTDKGTPPPPPDSSLPRMNV
ncbi:MAG: hypothetical protein JW929_03895 [Anaerolineales bacterium]|nr:hypothetical protein [Anaerolineales bacterium]